MASAIRTRPMEVLCLSLPRTGTMTIQHALRALGYKKVWHGDPESLVDVPPHMSRVCNELAIRKFRHKLPITSDELEDFLYDFDATTDIPPCYFWEDMLAAYPDAKVILVERDVDSWYQSCVINLLSTLFGTWHGWLYRNFAEPILGIRHYTLLTNLTFGFFHAKSYGELQRKAKQIYGDHYVNVRMACQKQGRPLLDFQLKDGWFPLCEFLGKPVPVGVEFPRVNDGKTLSQDIKIYHLSQIRAAGKVLLMWATVPGVAISAFLYWHYTHS